MTNGGTTLLSADYKAPGGKLLRVRLRETDGRIQSVKISGDFFLIPEDSLSKLEKMLEDVRLDEKELTLLVDRFFRGTSAQGLGVSPNDFVKAIISTRKSPQGRLLSFAFALVLPKLTLF